MAGRGFDPSTEVVLLRWSGLNDLILLGESRTDAAGRFSMPFPAGGLGECTLGLEVVLEVRTKARVDDHAGGWPRAVYRVPSLPLRLDPARGACQQRITVSGEDFAPGARVNVFMGSADPFAHNFGSLATATADTQGMIEVEVALILPPNCQPGEVGIYAAAAIGPRRKAVFTVTGP